MNARRWLSIRNDLQRNLVNFRHRSAKPPPRVRIPHSPPAFEYDVRCPYGVKKRQRMPSQSWRSLAVGSITTVPPAASTRITLRSFASYGVHPGAPLVANATLALCITADSGPGASGAARALAPFG